MYRSDEIPPLYRWNIFKNYSDLINTAVTGRNVDNHQGSDCGFNLALHTGDIETSVIGNRKELCLSQDIPFSKYTCAEQTHSANIHIISSDDVGKGNASYGSSIKDSDAFIVTIPHIMINIHLADCVPIVLYDFQKKVGALIHGGWKGTAQLISKKTLEYMIEKLDCKPGNIIGGIGPSIGSCCFGIGADTAQKLTETFSYSPKVLFKDNNQYSADLKQANLEQLIDSGIKKENIEVSSICTSCQNDEFYSYRADGKHTGRFSTFLILKNPS